MTQLPLNDGIKTPSSFLACVATANLVESDCVCYLSIRTMDRLFHAAQLMGASIVQVGKLGPVVDVRKMLDCVKDF
jgi:hypothetical protein